MGNQHTHKSELGQFLQNVARKDLFLVPFQNMRPNFVFGEVPHDALDFEQFLAVAELHKAPKKLRLQDRPLSTSCRNRRTGNGAGRTCRSYRRVSKMKSKMGSK